MPARSGDDDFNAPRRQRHGTGVVGPRAVKDQHGLQPFAVVIHERAHSAQVSFPFFSDVCDEQDGLLRLQPRRLQRTSHSDESGKTRSVVGNPRSVDAVVFAADTNLRARGKDGVEMRGEHHDRVVGGTAQFSDYIAGGVDLRAQAG